MKKLWEYKMTSREAIAKLNVLSSYDTPIEKREEYKECINAIINDLDTLDMMKENEKLFINNIKNVLEIEKENVRKETMKQIELDLKVLDILIKNIDIIDNEKAPIFITILTDNKDWKIVKDYLKERKYDN